MKIDELLQKNLLLKRFVILRCAKLRVLLHCFHSLPKHVSFMDPFHKGYNFTTTARHPNMLKASAIFTTWLPLKCHRRYCKSTEASLDGKITGCLVGNAACSLFTCESNHETFRCHWCTMRIHRKRHFQLISHWATGSPSHLGLHDLDLLRKLQCFRMSTATPGAVKFTLWH